MKINKLEELVEHFDNAFNNIDFANIPEKDSEEYRDLVLKTSNDQVFCDGNYKNLSAWKFDVLDIEDFDDALKCVEDINALTDEQRGKLRFYLDVKNVCSPLLNGDNIDWTSWPWNMENTSNSLNSGKLFDFIAHSEYVKLSAGICLYLKERVFDDTEFYTSVAQQEVLQNYEYEVKSKWTEEATKTDEGLINLLSGVQGFVSELFSVENHILVGRMLGMDHLSQSVYDALDTFIDREYHNRQVVLARELADWLRNNWDVDDKHPSKCKLQDLAEEVVDVMAKYDICSPDFDFTWDILTLDVLGIDEDKEFCNPWVAEWCDD